MNWAASLRNGISQKAKEYAERNNIPYYLSLGQSPTVMFEPYEGGLLHGNFLPASYKAILDNPLWSLRLKKPHQQAKAVPMEKRAQANELDSSNSSDALLMNIFCNPEAVKCSALAKLFGRERLLLPEFGIPGQVPLDNGGTDATEIDMRMGNVRVEAKLTEADFTSKPKAHVERYWDFGKVFEVSALPQDEKDYLNYQLIRNVLAAFAHNGEFFLICDARRPDLLRSWWCVMQSIKPMDLRSRCQFLLWQEIAVALPEGPRKFMEEKYGTIIK